MFYHLLYPLAKYSIVFNVFRYVTFRSIGAFITSLIISLLVGPTFIKMLRKRSAVETIDEDLPEKHRLKQGTPTMGGIIILFSLLISSLLWNVLTNPAILMMYLATVWLGILGFLDDYLKNFVKAKKGLIPRYKLLGQISVGLIITLAIYYSSSVTDNITALQIPFFKNLIIPLGWIFIPFAVVFITGTSNAVNLTDGLDGLAAGTLAFSFLGLGVMSYLKGNYIVADYLNLEFLSNAGELTVFISAIMGTLIGFLWFNSYPAQVFMGDTGSLTLGGIGAVISILLKEEIFFIIIGLIFVVETCSVIIQRSWFKYTKHKYGQGHRVFLCAPLHHHYELRGIHESKIVMRFYIVAAMLVAMGLSTIKLR
ncbi:MAG TPA: phospho-N-acetylmuramoyl-pentapeptide-transferase [Candidatus Cloacimonas sp.]|jgi:phospho-N-acetylmuramoyl-pentapeptide-transferase|nr:phospho-N-acetylmuramoyl-pentapeptide-transferase [Candidatus Cloacimonas sp.]MDD2249902.1 phospho-N-acetylmuramoyl-pentapeptide-transferase [Candidatus Cloacimonadota bacterium]MCK9157919.1 phospho-N-acetylmuramoyl-pentapeptide-transferase [Candidatus Cloacimonas sp.]MCK9164650.1 phospho-N-acetylmuramoyl-pentapeptide-transferase [Candidatus Cloacimonas sp.]MDD3733694.1 phospho-N-acetylmuramoyl-pentapeptide-transferase [Candidatus Cloacimonadota bacterium]